MYKVGDKVKCIKKFGCDKFIGGAYWTEEMDDFFNKVMIIDEIKSTYDDWMEKKYKRYYMDNGFYFIEDWISPVNKQLLFSFMDE